MVECAVSAAPIDHGQRIRNRVHPRAAVFGRHLDTHESELAHLADGLQRERALGVQLRRNRRNALLREIAGNGLDRQLFFAEAEIHE